jgi:hypothetical protein
MANEVYAEVIQDLRVRLDWENRQMVWSKMRNFGLRRISKPWPMASDLHVPLGDTIINKLKAYMLQWVLGPELLASFYSLNDQGDSFTDSCAQWFNYHIREKSNFNPQLIYAIDSDLQNGMGVLKVYWDVDKNQVGFCSILPFYCVVPPTTEATQDADRFTHVMCYSREQYKRAAAKRGLNDDEDLLDRIEGRGVKPNPAYAELHYSQEGLVWSRLKDVIIVWETYVKETDGNIKVYTYSPVDPDEELRSPFKLPYTHKLYPFVRIPYELTEGDWYMSRGVMEQVQMFEASATKMWNEKLDFMSIANRPVLSTQGGSINAQSIRWAPGEVYDALLQVVQQPPPPVSFDEEIQSTRSMAEQRVGIPDFGVGQDNQMMAPRTATETNAIATVMQQSNDLRARIIKGAMSEVYEQAWKLLLQYKSEDLDYFWRGQRITLPDAALDDCYVLTPNGSVDGYSRERDIQKLMQLRQLAQGAAWIQVNEIDCKIIELMDSQWINQLYIPPQEAQQDQMTKQATENVLLMSGYPAPIAPNDEHVTHLQVMDAFVRDAMGRPEGIAPDRLPLLMNHGMAHIQAARSNADYMKQYGVQIAQFASKINATQRQMAQAPAPGVAPGPANAPTSGPTRGAAAAVAPGGSNGGGPTPNIAGLPGVPATAAPAGPIPPGAAVPSALPPTRGRP